jgi:hypothetical protein
MTIKELATQLRDAQVIMAAQLEPQTDMRAIVDARTGDEMIAFVLDPKVIDVPLEQAKSFAPYCKHWQEWIQYLNVVTGKTDEQIYEQAKKNLIEQGADPAVIELLKSKLNDPSSDHPSYR